MKIGRMRGQEGMNILSLPRQERKRVLQMLWNFVSITIICVMMVQWPAPCIHERPFKEEWPTIDEMQDWADVTLKDGKFRKLTQDAYEEKWEIFYGLGTKITREYMTNGAK